MKLETRVWQRGAWSGPVPSELDSPTTLVLAFAAPEASDSPRPLDEIRQSFPRSVVLGCSTAGEIHDAKLTDGTVALAVARFERSTLRSAEAAIDGDSAAAGRSIGEQLRSPGLKAIFVLSDGNEVNGTELLRGLDAVVSRGVVVTGGLAGDGPRFERTWVLRDGAPAPGLVTAVGLYGDGVRVTHGSRGGFDKFGPERTVSRSSGNVLYELDGRPALELYKEYLGERAAGLPATALLFPLSVRAGVGEEKSLVRTVLGIDEATQSMRFAGDIPEGSRAQLMRANFDRLIDGAGDAGRMASTAIHGPVLQIAISCVGRRLVLGERTEEELEAALDGHASGTKQVGYYSYGEISPWTNGRCDLHNQTMTVTTFSEA